jgi:type III secretion system HrpE/YscL family protein
MNLALVMDRSRLGRSTGKVIPAEAYSDWVEARQLLKEATVHRARVLAALDEEMESVLTEGYAEGMARAKRDVAISMAETSARMEAAFLGLETRIVSTVIQTLQSMLGELGPRQVLEGQIRKVLQSAGNEPRLRLRVPPSAYELANALVPDIAAGFSHIDFIDVVKDPSLTDGACLLATEYGVVDGSLGTLLDAVREGLTASIVGKRATQEAAR